MSHHSYSDSSLWTKRTSVSSFPSSPSLPPAYQDALRRRILRTPSLSSAPPSVASLDTDYGPLQWDDFFTSKTFVNVEEDKFRVYKISSITKETINSNAAIILLHGGGYSGLTWSRFATLLTQSCCCDLYAIDLRGHGETVTGNEIDLSVGTLTMDVVNVINRLDLGGRKVVIMGHSLGGALAVHTALHLQPTNPVAGIIVVDVVEGTAMDSLASMKLYLRRRPTSFQSIELAIEWNVRGGHIKDMTSARVSTPGQLKCAYNGKPATELLKNIIENKVDRCCSQVVSQENILTEEEEETNEENSTSHGAEITKSDGVSQESSDSTPIQPTKGKNYDPCQLGASPPKKAEVSHDEPATPGPSNPKTTEDGSQGSSLPGPSKKTGCPIHRSSGKYAIHTLKNTDFVEPKANYVWRIDLYKTERYWNDWFRGLSPKFLSVPCPKLLLLAGTDRLDRDMTIAFMQGQYEMKCIPEAGHNIHEDRPERAVEFVLNFLIRQRLTTFKEE